MRPLARGSLLLAGSGLAFGSLTVLAKLAYAEGVTIPGLLVVRFGLAAVVLAPFAYAAARRPARFAVAAAVPVRRTLARAAVLGAVGYSATTFLYFHALTTLPAGVASFLLYLSPLLVALLARFLLKETLTRSAAWGLVAGLAGLAAIAFAPGVDLDPRGTLLALGSAVAYAGTILAGRRVVAEGSPWVVAAGVTAGATATWVALGAATGELAAPPTARAWALAATIAVVCTALAIALFYLGLPLTGAPRAAIISMIEPVSSVLLAAAALAERLTPIQAGGCALVLLGVWLATRPS